MDLSIKGIFDGPRRDIKRIKPFLKQIERIWATNPDLRFGQLMYNITEGDKYNPFYMEDTNFLIRTAAAFGIPYRDMPFWKKGARYVAIKDLSLEYLKEKIEDPNLDSIVREIMLNEIVLLSK